MEAAPREPKPPPPRAPPCANSAHQTRIPVRPLPQCVAWLAAWTFPARRAHQGECSRPLEQSVVPAWEPRPTAWSALAPASPLVRRPSTECAWAPQPLALHAFAPRSLTTQKGAAHRDGWGQTCPHCPGAPRPSTARSPRAARFAATLDGSAELAGEGGLACVDSGVVQLLLDAEQLVVLVDALAASGGARLDLASVVRDG